MKIQIISLPLLTILCLALSVSAFADDLYNNGPTLGNTNAYAIDIYVVSNSFIPTSNFITGFTFAEWISAGAIPLTVDWAIGTSSFGSDLASGTGAAINAALLCSNGTQYNGGPCGGGLGYDVYNSSVEFAPIPVSAGVTYWLTLTRSTDSLGGRDGWDINSGPSQAFHNLLGSVPSEAFTINGGVTETTTGTTPEPSSSIILFGSGILGLAGVLHRKLV